MYVCVCVWRVSCAAHVFLGSRFRVHLKNDPQQYNAMYFDYTTVTRGVVLAMEAMDVQQCIVAVCVCVCVCVCVSVCLPVAVSRSGHPSHLTRPRPIET